MVIGISRPVRYVLLPYSVRRISVHVNLSLLQACGLSVKWFSRLLTNNYNWVGPEIQLICAGQSGWKQQSPPSKTVERAKKDLLIRD